MSELRKVEATLSLKKPKGSKPSFVSRLSQFPSSTRFSANAKLHQVAIATMLDIMSIEELRTSRTPCKTLEVSSQLKFSLASIRSDHLPDSRCFLIAYPSHAFIDLYIGNWDEALGTYNGWYKGMTGSPQGQNLNYISDQINYSE